MVICDRCGKKCCETVTLRVPYQVDGIKEICRDCETEVNRYLARLRSLAINWWTRRIKDRIARRPVSRHRPSWWRPWRRMRPTDVLF